MDWIVIWVASIISFKLSTSGWRFLLKEILKFSFKRAHRIPKKMVEMDTKRDFWEAAYIQYYLEAKGYTIIFLDEFHINMRSESIYNWSCRGTPSVVAVEADPWNLSFVVAFSKRRIEGILASNFSINAKIFIFFLNDLWDRLENGGLQENKSWIIMDNASLHKWQETIKFLEKKRAKLKTITPYSPQLNAAEKMIALIKARLKKFWIQNKVLDLKLMKTIVDKVDSNSWERCIKSSRIEVFHKMKTLWS